MTLPYTGAAKRGILIVALIVASSTELLAQGTSSWLQAIDVLQTAFTGPIARGLSLIVCSTAARTRTTPESKVVRSAPANSSI